MTTVVRCDDRTVFEIDDKSLEPKNCGYYDAYCFVDPKPDVEYMAYTEWCQLRSAQFYANMGRRDK